MEPAIKRVARRTGLKPRTVAADRGYGEAGVDDALHNLGVRNVVIPRKGRPTKARQVEEHRRAFRRHLKWRTGCEGRISSLKRGYGWDRSRIDTTEGARIWVGHGVLTHNLVKISALASRPHSRAAPRPIPVVSDQRIAGQTTTPREDRTEWAAGPPRRMVTPARRS